MVSRLQIRDLGSAVPYEQALALQEAAHAAAVDGSGPDTLFLLEHPPLFTLGRSAHDSNVVWTAGQRAASGITLHRTSRGGDVTYHGPGQLVGYPIIHLRHRGLGVLDYVTALEEILIRVSAHFGLQAARDPRNRGIWVGNEKLAAIGIRVSRQVAMHGFALNVNTCLEHYRGIVPCGIRDGGVTSISRLLDRPVDMAVVKDSVVREMISVLRYEPGS